MFDSKAAIACFREECRRELQTAERSYRTKLEILDALPSGTPAPKSIHSFGYCADAGLVFQDKGLEALLLELYPPMPLVTIWGSTRTQKPEKYVRERDQHGHIEPIYPVVIRRLNDRTSLRWWTQLAGRDVEVELCDPRGTVSLRVDRQLYEQRDVNFANGVDTIFVRRVAPAIGLRQSAFHAWKRLWDEFCDERDYRTSKRAFVIAIRGYVTHFDQTPITKEALLERERNLQTLPWGDLGDFWACFTPEEADELLAFAEQRRQELPRVRKAEQEDWESIRRAAEELFATRGCPDDHPYLRDRITEYLRRATGLAVALRYVRGYFRQGLVALGPVFEWNDAYPDIKVKCLPETRLRMQDIPVVYAV